MSKGPEYNPGSLPVQHYVADARIDGYNEGIKTAAEAILKLRREKQGPISVDEYANAIKGLKIVY